MAEKEKMNGVWEGKIYGAINDVKVQLGKIETKVEERHAQNAKFFTKIDNLPCDQRAEETKGMVKDIRRLWMFFWFIVAAFLTAMIKHLMNGI